MGKEPPLDPPDYDEGPEPSDQEWVDWSLGDVDCLAEDDKVVEACAEALGVIAEAMKSNKAVDYAGVGKILFGAVEVFISEGELSDYEQDMKDKAAEDFVEPDPPDDDDYPEFYDGTGRH